VPPSGRLCIDHQHVRGFKAMPPEEKRTWVRGLLCFTCNRYRVAKNEGASARAVVAYLADFERRREAASTLRAA
jgi:hypothetical protein